MKIIIFGSEGFIGKNLIRHYTSKKYEVYGCDIHDKPSTDYSYIKISKDTSCYDVVFQEHKFDACVNASGSGNVSFSVTHPVNDFDANTGDTIKILDAIRKYNIGCKYLHISSAAVYGNPEKLPVGEESMCTPLSPYGWHKLMAEQLCREYQKIYRLRISIVRPFSIYGPGLRKQLFWDVFQQYKAAPNHIELWGSGNESRDFIYIDDVIQCFDLILQKAAMNAEVFNIASGEQIFIKDVVQLLFNQLPGQTVLSFNNKIREGDPLNWQADISRIKGLGFVPCIPLSVGIRRLAKWLLEVEPAV